MIVTLTLNPSLDRTIQIGRFRRDTVIRATGASLDPGGKGVNVTRALLANGVRSLAVLPYGGAEGEELLRLLRAEGVDTLAVPVSGRTRSNITLAEPDGTVTKINEPGAPLSATELERIADEVLAAAGPVHWVVACGSLPPEAPVDTYGQLCRRVTAAGVRFAVDTSGPALLSAVAAGPDLVKPNRDELADAVGAPITTTSDAVSAAQWLRALGAATVLASLGSDGAALVDAQDVLIGESPVAKARSTVGAGDAMLAGFLAGGATGAAALAEALSWGAAAVGLPGSRMPGPTDIRRDRVLVHRYSSADPSLVREYQRPT